MIFRTMTFRFAYANQLVERHKRWQLQTPLSLLSTTVAANQTKWSSICFCWESLNKRWVPSNIPMNTIYSQCSSNGLNHLSFLNIVELSVAIVVRNFVVITFSRLKEKPVRLSTQHHCKIMHLLTEWEGRTGKYLAPGLGGSNIFDLTQSIRILLYDRRAFPFFFLLFIYLFIFRVIKFAIGMFTYVAHFNRKFEIYIATKLFQLAFRKEL